MAVSSAIELDCHFSCDRLVDYINPPPRIALLNVGGLFLYDYLFVRIIIIINKLYCIVLYCIVLYCIVLYCIVLYCIVLYCIVLYCTVLYCIIII